MITRDYSNNTSLVTLGDGAISVLTDKEAKHRYMLFTQLAEPMAIGLDLLKVPNVEKLDHEKVKIVVKNIESAEVLLKAATSIYENFLRDQTRQLIHSSGCFDKG